MLDHKSLSTLNDMKCVQIIVDCKGQTIIYHVMQGTFDQWSSSLHFVSTLAHLKSHALLTQHPISRYEAQSHTERWLASTIIHFYQPLPVMNSLRQAHVTQEYTVFSFSERSDHQSVSIHMERRRLRGTDDTRVWIHAKCGHWTASDDWFQKTGKWGKQEW